MSQFKEYEMWHFDSYYEPPEEEIVGRLSIKSRRKKVEGPYVKNLIPGQVFRYAGSFCKRNIYMVVDSRTVPHSRKGEVYYIMLKNGKLYGSPNGEKKRVVLVQASLTLDD